MGQYVRTYTPKQTQDYENLVRESILRQCKSEILELYDGDIKTTITAYFVPNKSISKKKYKELVENKMPYLKKPDCDNIAKIILDSLNGIAFKDDNQVSKLEVNKVYGTEDKVEVEIIYLDKEEK